MNVAKFGLGLGLVGLCWSHAAWAQAPSATEPPAQSPPAATQPPPFEATQPPPAATQPAATQPAPVEAPPPPVWTQPPPVDAPPPPVSTQPPPVVATAEPRSTTTATATTPQPPRNIHVEASTPQSEALATRAASASMEGDPQKALTLAATAVQADPRDPWAHYDKAMALAHLGNVDDALKSFAVAEARFNPSDLWARSVAIYGGAHALSLAGRCAEAKRELARYADFVKQRDPSSADMALRYAADCRTPAEVPSTP